MGVERVEQLSHERLVRIVLAVRAVARASGPLDFERVLTAVLDQFIDALDCDQAAIYLLDERRRVLVWAGAKPPRPALAARFPEIELEDTFTGRVVAARRPVAVRVSDLPLPAGSALEQSGLAFVGVVPLHVQDRASGVVFLGRKQRRLEEDELRAADTLGELLVVYLENARLYRDAQARLAEMAMLLDAARSVTASLELHERLVASADALARLVEGSNAFIMLLDPASDELEIAEGDSSWDGASRGTRLSMSATSGASVRSIKERRAIVVDDATASAVPSPRLVAQHSVKSLIAFPLFVGDQPVGSVVVTDTRSTRPWTPAQVQRGEVIAHQIAIAVAHARLYDEVKRSYVELGRTQEELVKRERLAALGQLAATLAHEVRNPLGVLFNALSSLGKSLASDDDASMLLHIMDEEVRRLDRLVRELLDFVRPVTPSFTNESLHAIVEDAVEAAARELGADAPHLENEVSRELPTLPVDAAMLRRALLNLLVNGGQATGRHGHVTVRAAPEIGEGDVPRLRVEVVDDGPGILADVAPRIFEPFFTTKATGTGLGLAIVKEIVDAHLGEIRVDSGRRGTAISLVLPAATASPF